MHQLGARADLVVTLRFSAAAGVAASPLFAYYGIFVVLINVGFYKKEANQHSRSRKICFYLVVIFRILSKVHVNSISALKRRRNVLLSK